MSIFEFAKENDIKLTSVEELSILFHDAIYRPGSKFSESLSVKFMESLLDETGVKYDDINNTSKIILATARHLTDNDEEHKLVMDLDMSGFSAPPGEFTFQGEMIEKEFHNGHRSDLYTMEQFLNGRLKFLTKLQERKSIYRTPMFLKKFEKRAQTNLANAISEVKRRIESEL
jgi:predicted metal-dependent HD superfamily phosphohydrolase